MAKVIKSYPDLSEAIKADVGRHKLQQMSKRERLSYASSKGWQYKPPVKYGTHQKVTHVITKEAPTQKYTQEVREEVYAQPSTQPTPQPTPPHKTRSVTETVYASPTAARVLAENFPEEARGVTVSYGKFNIKKELTPTEYAQHEIARKAGKPGLFYETVRKPEPLSQTIKLKEPQPRLTPKSEEIFKAEQSEIWRLKKEGYTLKGKDVWQKTTEAETTISQKPDIVSRQIMKIEALSKWGWKKALGEERYERSIGKYEKYITPEYWREQLPKLEAIPDMTPSVTPFLKFSPLNVVKQVAGAGVKLFEEVKYHPIKSGVTVGVGAGFGAVSSFISKYPSVTLGSKLTSVLWKGGLIASTTFYTVGSGVEYTTTQTQTGKGEVLTKKGLEVGAFMTGYSAGAGIGGSIKSQPTKPPPPPPSFRSKPPKMGGKTFRPQDHFIKTEFVPDTTTGETVYKAVHKPTGHEYIIKRGEVHKFREIFGMRGKEGALYRARTSPKPSERYPEIPKRDFDIIPRGRTDIIPREFDLIPRKIDIGTTKIIPMVRTDIIPRGRTEIIPREFDLIPRKIDIVIRKTDLIARGTDIMPIGRTEIIPIGRTDLVPRGRTDIVPRGETEIVPRGETEIVPRGETDIILKEPIKPRPPKPIKPRPPPPPAPFIPKGLGFPWFPSIGEGGGLYSKFRMPKARGSVISGYKPSVSAMTFGIFGTKPSGKYLGLRQRPLLGKKPKKKPKKKKKKIRRNTIW